MIIRRADLAAVTARWDQYPPDDRPEIAFAGRSNVGKSSLLNLLTNRRKLAKVSGSPGKTRTINFFDVEAGFDDESIGDFRIVDLPGYGYAKVSKKVREDWGYMIETYLTRRDGLLQVAQLIDIRHGPTDQDRQMYEYLKESNLDGLVVATKADKISRGKVEAQMAMIRKNLDAGRDCVIVPVSSLKKEGQKKLLAAMEATLTGAGAR